MTQLDVNTGLYSPITVVSATGIQGDDVLVHTGACRLMFLAASGETNSYVIVAHDATSETSPSYGVKHVVTPRYLDFGPVGIQMDIGIYISLNGTGNLNWMVGYIA